MSALREAAFIVCGVFILVTSIVWYVMKILDTLQRIATALEGFTAEKDEPAHVAIDGSVVTGQSTKERIGGSRPMGFKRT